MRPAKDTQTDWGRSQPASSHGRRRALVVAGAVLAAAVVSGALAVRFPGGEAAPATTSDTARPSSAAQIDAKSGPGAPSAAPAIEVTPVAPVEVAAPVEAAASAAPNGSASTVTEEKLRAVNPAEKKPRTAPVSARRIEPVASAASAAAAGAQQRSGAKTLATKPSVQKETPPADVEDPLENRH
jgi:hypothetical protein